MENNDSIKNEEPKNLLKTISFDAIHYEVSNFVMNNNRRPTLIIMNPSDGRKFLELIRNEYGYYIMEKFTNTSMSFDYRGMRLLRSFDVEEGFWFVA